MPLEIDDADEVSPETEETRAGGARYGRTRWDEPERASFGRSRRRPASRAKRILITVAALGVLGGFAFAAYTVKTWLEHDARFRIADAGNIQAIGLTQVSRAQILPVFSGDIGHNIFAVSLTERRKQLEQIPWIEKATVMRLLPNQIRVSVVERQPVAFAREGDQFGLVDANGVLLSMPAAMMAQHHYSFPVVTGIDPRDPLEARRQRMQVYQRLLDELNANGQNLSAQISEIDLTDPSDAKVLMPEPGGDILAHFGQDHFLERYQRYKAHIAAWRQQYPKLAAVDLRYDQQVVLQMAPGTDVAANGADAPQATLPAANTTESVATTIPQPLPALSAVAVTTKTASVPSKKVRIAGKQGRKNSAKARTAREKALLRERKIARERTMRKKRAAASRRVAQSNRKPKPVPAARPYAVFGQGQ